MPFAFIFTGLVLAICGVRGTGDQLLELLKGDLTGKNNFFYWILAIILIGSLGYVDSLKNFSRVFLGLVLVVLILADNKEDATGGFFSEFTSAVQSITGA